MASPHSLITSEYVTQHLEEYRNIGFSYVRGGRNFIRFKQIWRGIALLARVTKSPSIYLRCYKFSVNKRKSYFLTTIAINRLTTLNQLKAVVDYCRKEKVWAILEFHGIDKADSEEYKEDFCWLEEDFVKLCDYIVGLRERGYIDVKNPIDAIKLMDS